jgi:hypothetical protein
MKNRNKTNKTKGKNTIGWLFSYYYICVNIRMDDMAIRATSHSSFYAHQAMLLHMKRVDTSQENRRNTEKRRIGMAEK